MQSPVARLVLVDPLPNRVRLTGAPGALRGAELETRRWRRFEGDLVIECTGPDGFGVFIPARWTDLPLATAATLSRRSG